MTEAGREFVEDIHGVLEAAAPLGSIDNPEERIARIEAEARADADATIRMLREALQDVVDTEGGAYEHFDGHCTPETECAAGHVQRILADTAPEANA